MIIIMEQSFPLLTDPELIELANTKGKIKQVKDVKYLKIEEDEA